MENQHKHIKGYRDLTEEEITQMNLCNEMAEQCGQIIEELKSCPGLDQRWVSIGATHLQQGWMAVIRGIAKPETF
jgi:hypothetical protein